MNEVSGRFAKWVYLSGIADGVPEDVLLTDVGVKREILQGGRRRISWDDYIQMLENYHGEVGLDKMRDSAIEFGTTQELEYFSKIAGLFMSPKNLYRFMYRWAGNHFLRNVNFDFDTVPDGTFRIVSRVDPSTRSSPVFFATLTNVLAGAPCRIGRPPAEVDLINEESHSGEYRIVAPRSASIGWRLKWPLRAIAAIPSFGNIFARQQEEIQQSHTAITRQQEDFRSMVEQISDCVFIVDAKGQPLFANASARKGFGISPAEVGDWRPSEMLDADALPAWEAFLHSVNDVEREFRFQTSNPREVETDGTESELALSFSPPSKTLFGETDALMLVGRDVTEARQVEARIREVAYEERRRIAADLHDGLGQVLTGINWKANLLASQLETDSDGEPAAAARSIAELATESTRQARDLAHGLAGIDERSDNLRRALTEHARKVEREFGLEVELRLPPSDRVLSAPGHTALEILRIVQEATNNAFKHAAPTKLQIALETDPKRWLVTVSDDGKGLPEDMATVSSSFGIRSMRYRASGLGGTVELRNRPEGGTELALSLPPQEHIVAEQPAAPKKRLTDAPSGGKSIRVMVADDHETVLQGIVAMLSNEPDMEVCCQTGEREDIIALALSNAPDVLVVDMLMDGDDNLDTIRKLRAALPELHIAVLSMFHEEQYGAEARAAGANAYVMKQSPPAQLIACVRAV